MSVNKLEVGDLDRENGSRKIAEFTAQTVDELSEVRTALTAAEERADALDTALAEAMEAIDALKARPKQPTDARNAEIVQRFWSEDVTGPAKRQVSRSVVGQIAADKSRSPWLGTGAGVVRMYGGYDVPGIERSWRPGLMDSEPVNDWHAELQDLAETLSVARHMGVDHGKTRALLVSHLQKGPDHIARAFSDNAGEGAELLPDLTMPVLDRDAHEARRLAANFQTRIVPAGGGYKNPFHLYTSGQAFRRGTMPAGFQDFAQLQASAVNLTESSYSVPTLAGLFLADEVDAEDAIIQWWPEARMTAVQTLVDAEEDATINGTAAATMADAVADAFADTALNTWDGGGRWVTKGSDNDHRLAYDGLRHIAYGASSEADVSTASTPADFLADAANLSAPYRGGELMLLTSSKYEIGTLLKHADLFRVDGSGSAATRLTGAVGRLGNRDVVTSSFVGEAMSTGGRYTGSGTTTLRLTVAPSAFEYVQRRGITVTLGSRPEALTGFMVFHMRRGFRSKLPASAVNAKAVYVGFNL